MDANTHVFAPITHLSCGIEGHPPAIGGGSAILGRKPPFAWLIGIAPAGCDKIHAQIRRVVQVPVASGRDFIRVAPAQPLASFAEPSRLPADGFALIRCRSSGVKVTEQFWTINSTEKNLFFKINRASEQDRACNDNIFGSHCGIFTTVLNQGFQTNCLFAAILPLCRFYE
jgi:hypothetical protein